MVGFLRRLEEAGEVRAACGAIGLSARSAYKLRERNPAFAQGWEAALQRREARERRALAALCDLDRDDVEGPADLGPLTNLELCRALDHVDDVLARAARSRQRGAKFGGRGGPIASTGYEL